jgi:hypothetical protein
MTKPRNATTMTSGKRFYGWPPAPHSTEQFWSATTILSALPKPALVYWSANEVAGFACDNLDQIQALLKKGERDAAYDMLKRAPWRTKTKAADLGTSVHAAIEAYLLNRPMPEWPIEIRPRMTAFQRFLDEYKPQVEMAEASVYNRKSRYAGTLDMVVTLTLPLAEEAKRYVLDVKSGKGVYFETSLQLSAYAHAEFVGMPDGTEQPMPQIDGGLVLHLTEDGQYRLLEVRIDDEIFLAFEYAREVFRFIEETSKGVFVGEYLDPVLNAAVA